MTRILVFLIYFSACFAIFSPSFDIIVDAFNAVITPLIKRRKTFRSIPRTCISSTKRMATRQSTTCAGVCFHSNERGRKNAIKEIALHTRNAPFCLLFLIQFFSLQISIRRTKKYLTKLIGKIYVLYFLSAMYVRETQPDQATVVANSPGRPSVVLACTTNLALTNTNVFC